MPAYVPQTVNPEQVHKAEGPRPKRSEQAESPPRSGARSSRKLMGADHAARLGSSKRSAEGAQGDVQATDGMMCFECASAFSNLQNYIPCSILVLLSHFSICDSNVNILEMFIVNCPADLTSSMHRSSFVLLSVSKHCRPVIDTCYGHQHMSCY